MAAFSSGDIVDVDYGEVPPCIHTRLVCDHVHGNDYIIITPDLDCYTEQLDHTNPDFVGFFPAVAGNGIPPAVNPAHVYAFAPMTAAQLAGHLAAGRTAGAVERARRGVAGVVGAPPAVAVAAPAAPEVWVMAESIPGKKIGEKVTPVAGFAREGDWGLFKLNDSNGDERIALIKRIEEDDIPSFCEERIKHCRDAEAIDGDDRYASEDVRTLEVRYGMNGERLRVFRETVKELQQTEFSDFPLQPRTALDYVRAIGQISESAVAQHHQWVSGSRIPEGDRSVYEDEVLARVLDAAVTYDALNISNLACMELVCRRRQLIADAHAQTPGMPSYLAADHFMGQTYRSGGGVVTSTLTEHVAKQMASQAQIMKEKRKLEEAKGKGKTKTPKPPAGNPKAGGGQQ